MKINNIPAKEFSIVRPHYNSSFLTEVQIEALKKICYGKDARETVDDVGEAPAKYEIVVGNTNRSGSLAIDDYDSFSVRIEGDKVYLNCSGKKLCEAFEIAQCYRCRLILRQL